MSSLLEMKQKSTKEYIALMEAWLAGQVIECQEKNDIDNWFDIRYPSWNFDRFNYRIKEQK